MWSRNTLQLIDAAIAEDLGQSGDLTAHVLRFAGEEIIARIVPREGGVICGLALLPAICRHFSRRGELILSSPGTEADGAALDGRAIAPGETVATVAGPRAAVLSAERTVLNFLSRMSGVATLTRRYVDAARRANPAVQILDTRKTIPGWRELDKYAVRCGGGVNHRAGLHDAVLIKDNHLAGVALAALPGWLAEMLRERPAEAAFVEVEVDSLAQLEALLPTGGVDFVLLDNFAPEQIRAAVALRDRLGPGGVQLEASGGITLATIGEIAASGVDRISVGALTHSAPALDIGLDTEAG